MRHVKGLALLVVVLVVGIAIGSVSLAQDKPKADVAPKLHGGESYTPRKLEWLALNLNAAFAVKHLHTQGYTMMFSPEDKTDTIVILLLTDKVMTERQKFRMETSLILARRVVPFLAKQHGWQDWVKVKERRQRVGE